METLNDLAPYLPARLQQGDYVALTFFLTTVAMAAGAIFFFFQFFLAPKKWKNSLLIMGSILTIAALNYFYMRDYWVETQISPTEFRYFDWLLTVPLICAEFYVLIGRLGAPRRKLWIMIIGSIWMLFFGYYGEAIDREHSLLWGGIATLGALAALFEMGMGIRWVVNQPNKHIMRGYITLFAFVVIFWNVYPLGFMTIPGNLLDGIWEPKTIDIFYNLADIVNKVIFSLLFFLLIIYPSDEYQLEVYGETQPEKLSFEEFKKKQLQQQAPQLIRNQENHVDDAKREKGVRLPSS